MMNEGQYVLYLFEKYFKRFKDKNIVLYGKGPMTELLVRHFSDYNIIGIMDNQITSGIMYGKAILTYEDLPYRNVDVIVPIARPESMKQIFNRIYKQCERNHIEIYGLNGDNLFETCEIMQKAVEEVDFVKVFREKFRDCWNKKIILYGKGPRTQRLIAECPEFSIIGVMDKELKEGEVCGKPILNSNQALELEADMIIAIARPEHLPVIYQRIREFCSLHHIRLYDVEGNNLFITQHASERILEPSEYFGVSEDRLREQISEHDVISFDVFDTLIMRKTLIPRDVYQIVEDRAKEKGIGFKDFHKYRWQAELDTVAEIADIYGIYSRMQEITGIPDVQKDALLALELETEKSVLIRRDKMVEIMDYAISLGKPVYLISDMYLTHDIIRSILDGLHIIGYKKLYVSCEYNKNKVTGIYDIYKEQVAAKRRLHIGDHPHSDGIDARKAGLDAFVIKKATEMLDISSYAPIQGYVSNINERSMLGLFAARVFNDPFALWGTDGRKVVRDVKEFGYGFVAPLITKYMLWLVERLQEERDWEDILFAARDGYLIQQLYQRLLDWWQLTDMPRGIYFQASRHAVTCASMQTDFDIQWISRLPYYSTPELMIHQSFDLPMEEVLPYDKNQYEDITAYGMAHKDSIVKNSKQLAKRYLKYMDKIGLKHGKKYIFWDLVASGTCHYGLAKIAPFELKSLYLCNYDSEKPIWRELPADAMIIQNLQYNDNTYASYKTNHYFFQNYFLLETMITSLGTTLLGFTDEGEPVYGEEVRSEEELRYIVEVQEAITGFFEDYIQNLYIRNKEWEISDQIVEKLYSFKDSGYTNECCEVLDHIYLHEEMIHGKVPLKRK